MYKMTSAVASLTAKLRWVRIPKEERSRHIPHNGGRPRLYPRCQHYRNRVHRFDAEGRCACGYWK